MQVKPIEITKKAPHAEALLLSERAVRPVRREVNGHPGLLYAPEAAWGGVVSPLLASLAPLAGGGPRVPPVRVEGMEVGRVERGVRWGEEAPQLLAVEQRVPHSAVVMLRGRGGGVRGDVNSFGDET